MRKALNRVRIFRRADDAPVLHNFGVAAGFFNGWACSSKSLNQGSVAEQTAAFSFSKGREGNDLRIARINRVPMAVSQEGPKILSSQWPIAESWPERVGCNHGSLGRHRDHGGILVKWP